MNKLYKVIFRPRLLVADFTPGNLNLFAAGLPGAFSSQLFKLTINL